MKDSCTEILLLWLLDRENLVVRIVHEQIHQYRGEMRYSRLKNTVSHWCHLSANTKNRIAVTFIIRVVHITFRVQFQELHYTFYWSSNSNCLPEGNYQSLPKWESSYMYCFLLFLWLIEFIEDGCKNFDVINLSVTISA